MFAHFPPDLLDRETQEKIDTVVRYVLHPDYQALPDGYGIVRSDKRRYHVIGWNVDLPGYNSFNPNSRAAVYFIQRIELMAHFAKVLACPWFRRSVDYLDTYRTERGTWLFPRRYLKELVIGYWVTGAHMGLEENRRSVQAIEIESTFRMLRIRKFIHHRLPSGS